MSGAIEIRQFAVTCPLETAIASAQTTNIAMPVRTVKHIRVRIPPGPGGEMGFALTMAGQSVIPTQANTYLIADNEIYEWDDQDWPNSGAWQVKMYNQGTFDHTIYLTFTVELPDPADTTTAGVSPDIASLSATAVAPIDTTTTDLPPPPELT